MCRRATVAQLVEHLTRNEKVASSILAGGSKRKKGVCYTFRMKTAFIVALAAVVLIGAYLYFAKPEMLAPVMGDAPMEEEGEEMEGTEEDAGEMTGTVTEVDTSGAALDKPVLIRVRTAASETFTVAVPTMGLPLCKASANIADAFSIKAGDTISVKGEATGEGTIVPCVSADHYLRVAE